MERQNTVLFFAGMGLVLCIQIACIIIMKVFCPTLIPVSLIKTANTNINNDSTATSFRNDPTLFHLGSRTYTIGYVIEADSMLVKGLDPATYETRKSAFRMNLLRRCDSSLQQANFPMVFNLIADLLNNVEENRPLIDELNRFKFFFLDEYIDSNDYYKATMCIAKDKSMDSIIAVINSRICITRVLNRWIFTHNELPAGMEISLQQIVNIICKECPASPLVQQIKKTCGNSSDCDSIYFESAKYNISQATRLILDCIYTQFKRKYQEPCTIDFYGYTDSRPVADTIYYYGNGAYRNTFDLLPDVHRTDTLLSEKMITNNEQLSFARGYSCFAYLRPYKRDIDSFRYSGGGVGNFDQKEPNQRTVKIKITKRKK